jgi:acetolactate synthase small subunit
MKRAIAIASISFLLVTLASAHGNLQHVIGTISAINGDSITVETIDHQSKVVYVTDKTTFTKSGAAATRDALKVGDRVVIHAQKEGDKLMAHTVALGVASAIAQHKH